MFFIDFDPFLFFLIGFDCFEHDRGRCGWDRVWRALIRTNSYLLRFCQHERGQNLARSEVSTSTKAAGRQSGSFGTSRTAVSAGTPASHPLPGRCRLVHGLPFGTVLLTRAEVRGRARCVRVGRRRNHALAFDQLWIMHAPCRSNRSRDAAAR